MATSSRRGRPPHNDLLTPAEWTVVHAVKHGMTSRQIAERRGMSIDAVKYHVANALAKLGLTNRKALRHWHQAPLQSALHQKDPIMDSQTRLGPIGQIARTVRDIEEAQTWYSAVLGIPHLYTFGKLAFFDCGGTRLMLTEEPEVASSESVLYLRVADIAAACANLRSSGVDGVLQGSRRAYPGNHVDKPTEVIQTLRRPALAAGCNAARSMPALRPA